MLHTTPLASGKVSGLPTASLPEIIRYILILIGPLYQTTKSTKHRSSFVLSTINSQQQHAQSPFILVKYLSQHCHSSGRKCTLSSLTLTTLTVHFIHCPLELEILSSKVGIVLAYVMAKKGTQTVSAPEHIQTVFSLDRLTEANESLHLPDVAIFRA